MLKNIYICIEENNQFTIFSSYGKIITKYYTNNKKIYIEMETVYIL